MLTWSSWLALVGVDLLFAPDIAEMYPPGFATTISVGGLTEHLCGPHRPGHFAGYMTTRLPYFDQAVSALAVSEARLVAARRDRDHDNLRRH
ncbi:MAG: 4-phosphopantoate--beta-alanine ligase [Rhodospirillales bacterium]|nr:4-phosphopantoate--beta-alanine ligase [Rhodospirillales bacterium]